MNWWEKLFWTITLKVSTYTEFSSDGVIAAKVTVSSWFHKVTKTYELDDIDYMNYLEHIDASKKHYVTRVKAFYNL